MTIRVLLADDQAVIRQAFRAVVDAQPDMTVVVVVTTFDLDEYLHTALQYGAAGFILKRSGPALLVEAIRAAVAGDTLVSPQLTTRLLSRLRDVPADPRWSSLTEREKEVAELVADGGTNADIAEQLVLSPGTVKNHLASIQRKLDVRNRVGIAAAVWSQRRPPS
ncbi:LuxR C-terminal-related transcriptional regulator [Kribbella sp. NPDC050470]|uniref:LuxR C-terminal-related transcriptional regulator n=1 Tax=unclassified Kribbella TaxID=2644121 RepID=UPI0037B22D11